MPPLDLSAASCKQKAEILRYAVEHRKFEIERFWQRSIFFWGFIAAAFVAYAALYTHSATGNALLLFACFGLISSIAWALQNRGSKYWQEAWEQKVAQVEKDVLGVSLFANVEDVLSKGVWGARKYSVSKLAIALADFTVVVWIPLVINALSSAWTGFFSIASFLVALTIAAIWILLVRGRSSRS